MQPSGKPEQESAFLQKLGQRVREARADAGATRKQLSQRSGISERYLAQLESGAGNISILLIRRVAMALKIDLARLVAQSSHTAGRATRIALMGMRGAGKSTLGTKLAAALDVPFVELDAEIERAFDTKLETVFMMYGHEAYREAERKALLRVTEQHSRCVIATGGSAVLDSATYEILRERCHTIWLKAQPEDHMNRVIEQGDLRPIRGREHAMAELRSILQQREPLYALADATLDTSQQDEAECLRRLTSLVAQASDEPQAP
jgi:XRE family transcriptional regulator, aerobic/anaerobic benzoate catabolism transcriptional regulator